MNRLFIAAIVLLMGAAFAQTVTKWKVEQNKDSFTGADKSYAALLAVEHAQKDATPGASLIVRCNASAQLGYEIYLYTGTVAGMDPVDWKFGSGAAQTATWDPSQVGDAIFVPDAYLPQFLANLENQDLAIRFTDAVGIKDIVHFKTAEADTVTALGQLSCLK